MEMDDDTPVVIDEQGRIHDGRTFSGGRARARSRLPLLAVVLAFVAMVAIGVTVASQSGPARAGGPPAPAPAPVSDAKFLDQEAQRGEAAARSILDLWIPQLSAKRVGLRADGIVYDDASLRRQYEGLKQRYPDALLVRSGTFSSFTHPDFWVVVVPRTFPSGPDVNSWCAAQGFDRDNCFAKRLSTTSGPRGNTLPRN